MRSDVSRTLFRTALLLALLTPLQSCAFFTYTAEPIEAWVVDAATNQPLEGVIVVAHWQLKGGLEGGNPVGQMMVLETVTDAKGRFYFPGWGPKLRSLEGRLKTQSPSMLLFKSGYGYKELENDLTSKTLRGNLDSPLRSDWNGKTIKMEKFIGGLEQYVRHLSFLMGGLRFIEDDCNWKITPKMILALQRQSEAFKASGIVTAIYSVDYLPTNEAKCGSPKEFFRSYHQ